MTPPSVQDVLLRHVAGVRNPEVGNSFWSRKLLGPELGNALVPFKGKSFDDLNPFH